MVSTLQRGWKREVFRRFRFGGITCWRLVSNARRIGRIIGSDSTIHFDTSQSHGNYLKGRKLGMYELILRDVDFAACQRSVQCCKTGNNLLGNAEMGGLTPPTVLSKRCCLRQRFVAIDGTRPGSSAFPLLWRDQKMDRFVDRLKRPIVFSRWYPTNARKMEKSSG